jgi:hypothetical protein
MDIYGKLGKLQPTKQIKERQGKMKLKRMRNHNRTTKRKRSCNGTIQKGAEFSVAKKLLLVGKKKEAKVPAAAVTTARTDCNKVEDRGSRER